MCPSIVYNFDSPSVIMVIMTSRPPYGFPVSSSHNQKSSVQAKSGATNAPLTVVPVHQTEIIVVQVYLVQLMIRLH